MTISEQKKQLRRIMKEKRMMLSDIEQYHSAQELCRHWYAAARLRNIHSVAAYQPIQSEISPIPLMRMLQHDKVSLALPVTLGKDTPLTFYRYALGDALTAGQHGILEPAREHPVTPEAILVPLLAYDLEGVRLGYGGGYYDRTLAKLHQNGVFPLCIGLAYDFQKVESLPNEAHDVTLDAVLTPEGIDWFN
jgi:5-formyltetrahydrofolate cyclo-ligase